MAIEDFSYRLDEEPARTIVTIRGEIDLSNAADLAKALGEAADRGEPVVIDAGELTFIDSAGFAAIQRLIERATVQLVVPPGCATARGFGISGLAEVVPMFDSLDDARRSGDTGAAS
jgi:anti-anti-sigma factor